MESEGKLSTGSTLKNMYNLPYLFDQCINGLRIPTIKKTTKMQVMKYACSKVLQYLFTHSSQLPTGGSDRNKLGLITNELNILNKCCLQCCIISNFFLCSTLKYKKLFSHYPLLLLNITITMSMHKKRTFCKNPKDGHPFSNTLLFFFVFVFKVQSNNNRHEKSQQKNKKQH